ncbi:hypothetical protein Y032_0147g2595 [Ancylostoma ceylanicum]|uniref:Uncharacterized protein n=1 Tax=Ancylostoma ceylanicum TaxID=53326 RepID=A0A016T1Z5_9BILA|nr:hypothetical protein Y032_0147g2595 [Ancylostoma ceylanicum]
MIASHFLIEIFTRKSNKKQAGSIFTFVSELVGDRYALRRSFPPKRNAREERCKTSSRSYTKILKSSTFRNFFGILRTFIGQIILDACV